MSSQLIYKITNTVNNLLYVGRTVNLHTRWLQHKDEARHSSHKPIHNAMRQHGIECFHIEIIEECADYPTARTREAYWIRTLNTVYPQGYNVHVPLLTDTEAAIIKYNAWGWPLHQYAYHFGMKVKTLSQLRQGASYYHVTRKHLPSEFS